MFHKKNKQSNSSSKNGQKVSGENKVFGEVLEGDSFSRLGVGTS